MKDKVCAIRQASIQDLEDGIRKAIEGDLDMENFMKSIWTYWHDRGGTLIIYISI